MGTSITLFRVMGIDMRVHWTFLLILAYGAFAFGDSSLGAVGGAIYGIVLILLLFVCVTLHEFGHAFVAQRFGVKVPYITLLPIGGVASLERMPDRPMEELLIAIAGPLVNFALVLLLLPITLLSLSFSGAAVTLESISGVLMTMFNLEEPGALALLSYLVSANLWLGIFNLLPAFPMDGGRILRALLAMSMPYVRATRIAAFIGRGMAGIFALIGIFWGGIGFLLIAFFVYIGAGAERESVESRAVLRNVQASEALTPSAVSIYTSEPISRVVDLIMNSYQTDYPVLDLGNNFVGVLTRSRLIYALKTGGAEARIPDVMLPAENVPTCKLNDNLSEVWELISRTGVRAVAVMDRSKFVGLITVDDITEVFQVLGAAMDGGTPLSEVSDAITVPDDDKGWFESTQPSAEEVHTSMQEAADARSFDALRKPPASSDEPPVPGTSDDAAEGRSNG